MKKIFSYLILSFVGFYISIVFDIFPITFRIIFFTLSSVIFIYFLYQFFEKKIFLEIPQNTFKSIFYILFLITGIVWIFLVFHRYYILDYTTWDDITYANSVYNLVKTGKFYNTIFEAHALGDHTVFHLALFYPFFKIYPSILWLIFFRAITTLACPLILIKIGKELNLKGLFLWIAPILFLVHSFVLDFMRETIHPSAFSLPFILLSFLYAIRKDYTKMFLYLIFIIGFKENLPLVWISMSFYIFLFQKKPKLSLSIFISGILLGLFLFFIIKPYFYNLGQGIQSTEESLKIIDNIQNNKVGHLSLFSPFSQIPQKFFLLFSFLASFAFVQIFSIKSLIFALPSLSLSLLAYKPLDGHHLAIPIVVFFVAFVVSLAKLQNKQFEIKFFHKYRNQIFSIFIFISILLNSTYVAYFAKKSFLFQHKKEAELILSDIEKLKITLDQYPNYKVWVNEKISAYLLKYYLRTLDGDITDILSSDQKHFIERRNDWDKNPRFIIFPNTKEYHFLYLRKKTFKMVQDSINQQLLEGKLKKLEQFKHLNVYQSN